MHEQTYIVKIKVKSKSNFQISVLESMLVPMINFADQKGNVNTTIHIAEKEIPSEFIGKELKMGGPTSFVPMNCKGETFKFVEKI